MEVLNLFAGIGGNRTLWQGVNVTAVEKDTKIAAVYKDLFPADNVLVGDAHSYLSNNFMDFDFIWSSPPCQSHSRIRQFVGVNAKGFNPVYPDMTLYQQIIFLQHNAKCRWLVENVNPYYEPLIEPAARIGRHLFWSNFEIPEIKLASQNLRVRNTIDSVESLHSLDASQYNLKEKRQALRNCVDAELGLYILQCAFNGYEGAAKTVSKFEQRSLLF